MPRPAWIDCIVDVRPWYDDKVKIHGVWIMEMDPRTSTLMNFGPATTHLIAACNKHAKKDVVCPGYGPHMSSMPGVRGFMGSPKSDFYIRAIEHWWTHTALREMDFIEYLNALSDL